MPHHFLLYRDGRPYGIEPTPVGVTHRVSANLADFCPLTRRN